MINAVEARELVKRYGDLVAVDSITFDIASESCFGFLGPNGAGKTTTMQMLTCALPPTSGTLNVLGMAAATSKRQIKDRIGVVAQNDNLDEEVSVWENLLIYGRYFGLRKSMTRSRADELLEFMALTDKRDKLVTELSGGMRRRLMIARGLLAEPNLLVLDEPTTGLDPQARHMVWEKLRSLKRQGVTIVITTHYMEEAAQLCDRLVIMDGGRILSSGPPREMIDQHTSPEVVEVFEPPIELQSSLRSLESASTHIEQLADRWLLYTDSGEEILSKVRAMGFASGSVWLRGGSLEDVFLAMTGRGLLE